MKPRLARQAGVLLVAVAALGFTAFFSWFAIERHQGLMTHTADLGQIDLAIWNTLHGRFVQEIKGEGVSSRLTDHIEPIFWPVSLVFGLWDDARALLSLQAFVLGLTALLVWGAVLSWWPGPVTTTRLIAATWAALAYLVAPATQAATVSDFHASPLAVLPLALLLLLGRRRRTGPALVAAVTAMAVKEEIALVVAAACLVLALTARWRAGYPMAVLALGWFLLATAVIIPSYSVEAYGEATMPYLARYETSDVAGESATPLSLVTGVLQRALSADRLRYLAGLLAAFAFLPLMAPEITLAAAPLIAANVLSHYPAQFSGEFHYSAPFMSVFAIAAGIGAARAEGWTRRWGRVPKVAAAVVAVLLPVAYHASAGFTPLGAQYYLHRPTSSRAALLEGFRPLIPADASLSVTPALHPHFSHRERIYTFPALAEADFVLLDVAGTTDMHPADVRRSFDALLTDGYGIARANSGMVLLKRGATDRTLPADFCRFATAGHDPDYRLDVAFGTSLRLLGYDWLDDAKWGFTSLRLYWETLAPLDDSLTPYALLVDGLGEVVTDTRSASFLEPFWLPPSQWASGWVYTTTTVPADLGEAWGAYVGVVADEQFDEAAARLTPSPAGAERVITATNLVRLPPVHRVRNGLRPALAAAAAAAPPSQTEAGPLGGWLMYHGIETHPQVTAGYGLRVVTYWSRSAAPVGELALSVRLLDGSGNTVAQTDGPVQQGLYPPSAWTAGEVVPDVKRLPVPAALPPGTYTAVVIAYDRGTASPLDPEGAALGLGVVRVLPAEVQP